ncbi:hypothetical protein [Pseudomonas sp. 24 E 1]|nr:hypothetical protein [Pseudomonas sp. 35 E 8]CRM42268.1 hypothetical protein [Pseudomonas sp. 24 E 1]CRM56992.1 hypothetical protein [Pseudomonas sp. 58 R 12]CRM63946.1 hypothetical protein [Pseudomonas sp. 24 R 17]
MGLGQQQLYAAVVEHVGQALTRVFRVQRHIGATGLEDGEQAHHHVDRAFHSQAHQHVRAHPRFDQAMGQAIGAAVQLRIIQTLLREDQRRCIRRARGLLFDQLMHAAVQRVIARSGIPVVDHVLAHSVRQGR